MYFFTEVSYGFLLSAGALLYGVFALALTSAGGRNLQFAFSQDGRGKKGEENHIILRVTNPDRVPLLRCEAVVSAENLLTEVKSMSTLSFSVKPGGKEELGFVLREEFCGCVKLKLESVKLTDPFGVFERPLSKEAESEYYILPEMSRLPMAKDELDYYNMESYKYSATRKGEDLSEMFGVKAYVPGDSVKAIHWKLSGKMGDVMIKEPSYPVENSLMILLDKAAALSPEETDRAVTLYLSLSYTAAKMGLSHSLGWYDYRRSQFECFTVGSTDDIYSASPALLSSPYRADSLKGADRFLAADTEKNYTVYLYVTESDTAEEDIERLRMYGEVRICRAKKNK